MFQGQRGWFCGSVSHALRQFWVAEGGTISDPRAADFLFSCDASHPDTLRIYQSLDYIEDNATIFHAYYLSAVANAEIKNSVALGHFILPPACLQKEIRRKIGSFIWEQDQHFLIEKHDEVTPNEIKALGESSKLATDHEKELSKSCSMWDAASAWFDERCHVHAQDSNQGNTGPPTAECANLTTRPRGQPPVFSILSFSPKIFSYIFCEYYLVCYDLL
uniref:Telomere repeat binding bouquet formation protein 2 n=1 Tax=Equus caballus TaxID=9796 RepID=A0A9L0TGC3_HORSE